MPRIRCYYDECVFNKKGICLAPSIELDPEDGCLTYSEILDAFAKEALDAAGDDVYEDESWEKEGFQELEDIDFSEDEDYG